MPGLEPPIFQPVAQRYITELSRLHIIKYNYNSICRLRVCEIYFLSQRQWFKNVGYTPWSVATSWLEGAGFSIKAVQQNRIYQNAKVVRYRLFNFAYYLNKTTLAATRPQG
jgi:hypothetical protein